MNGKTTIYKLESELLELQNQVQKVKDNDPICINPGVHLKLVFLLFGAGLPALFLLICLAIYT